MCNVWSRKNMKDFEKKNGWSLIQSLILWSDLFRRRSSWLAQMRQGTMPWLGWGPKSWSPGSAFGCLQAVGGRREEQKWPCCGCWLMKNGGKLWEKQWFQWDHDGKWWKMDGKMMDDVRKHGIFWHIFRPTLPWGEWCHEWCHGAEGTCAMPNTDHPSWMGCGGPTRARHGFLHVTWSAVLLWWIAFFDVFFVETSSQVLATDTSCEKSMELHRNCNIFFIRFKADVVVVGSCGASGLCCTLPSGDRDSDGLPWCHMSHIVRKAVVHLMKPDELAIRLAIRLASCIRLRWYRSAKLAAGPLARTSLREIREIQALEWGN